MARRGLGPDLVIETAEQLVDTEGWSKLTMTALARELGVRTPSLYSHVGSIEDVLAGVQARAMRSLGDDLQRAAMGRSGAEGFREMALALRAFAEAHPGSYELAMGEPIVAEAVIDASSGSGAALAAMIRSFGVAEVGPELMFSCLAHLHGVLHLDRAGLFRQASIDVDSVYSQAIDLVVHLITEAAGTPR